MQPIRLDKVENLIGFSASSFEPGQMRKVLVRAGMTSNEALFHKIMAGLGNFAPVKLNLNRISHLFLVIHSDDSAELYLNDFSIHSEMMLKKTVNIGDAVFRSDLADLRRIRFPEISLKPTDKILVCCKIGWKFALYFDLNPDTESKIEKLEFEVAKLFRYLMFEESYAALADETTKAKLIAEGWFPFTELIGDQFEKLTLAYSSGFSQANAHGPILSSFDNSRLDRIKERWKNSIVLCDRIEILTTGLDSYARKDSISCLKIMLTEIEGLLREIRKADTGEVKGTIAELLDYICNRGLGKAGDEASLLFPKEFREYLASVTFQNFDPSSVSLGPISRHSAGHGASPAFAYTMERALQAILTVDQIAFFL